MLASLLTDTYGVSAIKFIILIFPTSLAYKLIIKKLACGRIWIHSENNDWRSQEEVDIKYEQYYTL